MPLQIVQIVYWLGLSTWFGGVLFIGIASQVIVKTVTQSDPHLPDVRSATLEGQHGTLLAGTIIANLLSTLAPVQFACAGLLLVTIVAQWFLTDLTDKANLIGAIVRSAMFLAATVLALYDRRVLWVRTWKSRQRFIDNADDPEMANPALEEFNRGQREGFTLLSIQAFLLMGIILFSGQIATHAITVNLP